MAPCNLQRDVLLCEAQFVRNFPQGGKAKFIFIISLAKLKKICRHTIACHKSIKSCPVSTVTSLFDRLIHVAIQQWCHATFLPITCEWTLKFLFCYHTVIAGRLCVICIIACVKINSHIKKDHYMGLDCKHFLLIGFDKKLAINRLNYNNIIWKDYSENLSKTKKNTKTRLIKYICSLKRLRQTNWEGLALEKSEKGLLCTHAHTHPLPELFCFLFLFRLFDSLAFHSWSKTSSTSCEKGQLFSRGQNPWACGESKRSTSLNPFTETAILYINSILW